MRESDDPLWQMETFSTRLSVWRSITWRRPGNTDFLKSVAFSRADAVPCGNENSLCCYLRSLAAVISGLAQGPVVLALAFERTTPSSLMHRSCNSVVVEGGAIHHVRLVRVYKWKTALATEILDSGLSQYFYLLLVFFFFHPLIRLIYKAPVLTSRWICLKRNLRYAAQVLCRKFSMWLGEFQDLTLRRV